MLSPLSLQRRRFGPGGAPQGLGTSAGVAPQALGPMDDVLAADARWDAAGVALHRNWWAEGRRPRDPRGPLQGTVEMIMDLGGGTCVWQGGRHVAEDLSRLRGMEIGSVAN